MALYVLSQFLCFPLGVYIVGSIYPWGSLSVHHNCNSYWSRQFQMHKSNRGREVNYLLELSIHFNIGKRLWQRDLWLRCMLNFTATWLIMNPGVQCNTVYPSETRHKLKFREISFVRNTCVICPNALNFCTKHGSDTAMLCAKFQNDWIIDTDVMDECDFAIFEFKMSFQRISRIAQHPWLAA